MRAFRVVDEAPPGSVRLVGVLGGEPIEESGVAVEDMTAIGFNGKPGETVVLVGRDGPVVLVGLGDTADFSSLARAAGAAGRVVPRETPIVTALHQLDIDGALDAVVGGLGRGTYRFDQYRSANQPEPGDVCLLAPVDSTQFELAVTVAGAASLARDWTNQPPGQASPEWLAEQMAADLAGAGFDVELWDEDRLAADRAGGILGVAAGSTRPPRLVVGRYRPVGATSHLALVGKGITFDSGGLSLKTAEGMETMKHDMAGGAAVAAAAGAIGRLHKTVAVSVFVPLTDNMPSGSATKPGDVLTIRNGKTIEVLNTDAEGRLVLADGLSLAAEEAPDLVVDVATLTGAARVALGQSIAALFSSGTDAEQAVLSAAGRAGERVWPMPLPADYRSNIDSTVADMKNTGGRYGGAINAALLLREFVGDTPWVHLDIAGPSWLTEDGALGPKGASGFGVATIVALASEMESPSSPTIQ